jgi:glycosidase
MPQPGDKAILLPASPVRFPVEFHIAREARKRYGLDRVLYGLHGNVLIADLEGAQLLAERINAVRGASSHPARAVRAGQVNAVGLIDEVFHYMAARYREMINPAALPALLARLEKQVGGEPLRKTLNAFVDRFPGSAVWRDGQTPEEYLRGVTEGIPNRQILCEELLMLFLANADRAFDPLSDLFDEAALKETTAYREICRETGSFFESQPAFGPENLPLLDLLLAPIRASPRSLPGQITYIVEKWKDYLSPELLRRLLISLDIIKEEERMRGMGPGPVVVPDFARFLGYLDGEDARRFPEYEKYSTDLDWMPRVVLLAKNTYVWLDQLSKRYARPIRRLDQIPDEELDRLRDWGFTGLWLIGLWERSAASRKIKHACGNPEAGASAYSLFDYTIAAELGGENALRDLKERTLKRGIKLSSDMVPNHTGIYSRWVIDRPDWFIQVRSPPFPGYRFTGQDLSDDPRVRIAIEDGYWTKRDAAVVFERRDKRTGDVRYIYHGNDGTNMPWNDTAQIDFLNAEAREAVIQTVLAVARRFHIIRFDAAMVLTRQHFQRLWFPPPGAGGAIPSRAGRGLTAEEFDRLMPKEFWREVVDRVAKEVPETLLLAEAFWLLEGYFVRTLGMHRVYNSAFMNMLKMELNSEYRQLVKNILEFDPQIMRRFVNFMSNPDEATAVAQFGKGDKYFGVCTMMVTMPGLPLFGHGQLEGLTEKYGMEYRKAYWDEPVDKFLVSRHESEIFPLMKRRALFSDVANFYLYDFYLDNGRVNEDVFAYSNRYGNDRALVFYHNRYSSTSGWVRLSSARLVKDGAGGKRLERTDLADGLGIRGEANDYCVFRDLRSNLEYIRSSRVLRKKGFQISLAAYQTTVFTDFREIRDDGRGLLRQLDRLLNGRGVRNINEAVRKIRFASLHRSFQGIFNPDTARRLVRLAGEAKSESELALSLRETLSPALSSFFREVSRAGGTRFPAAAPDRVLGSLEAVLLLLPAPGIPSWKCSAACRPALKHVLALIPQAGDDRLLGLRVLLLWSVLKEIEKELSARPGETTWLKEWFLGETSVEFLESLGADWDTALREFALLTILLRHAGKIGALKSARRIASLAPIFEDAEVKGFLNFNWYEDTLWLSAERIGEMADWLGAAAQIERALSSWTPGRGKTPRMAVAVPLRAAQSLRERAAKAGYQVKEFLESFAAAPAPAKRKRKNHRSRTRGVME